MKIYFYLCVFIILLTNGPAWSTVISYQLNDIGDDKFEYVYTIENDTLQVPVEQFTIWFDVQLYDNLQITTQTPLANDWDEIILPSTGFGVPLGYDALEITGGIAVGGSLSGFTVSFDWYGDALLGPQSFDIIDPVTSQTIDFGNTVPEPVTLFLFAYGIVAMRFCRHKKT